MIARVDGFLGRSRGGASGGTLATVANMLDSPQLMVRSTFVSFLS